MYDRLRLEHAVRERLSEERLRHTLGVAETAVRLARQLGLDEGRARAAALLHDYAKGMPPQRLLELGRRYGLVTDPAEEAAPDLLHGPVASVLVQEEGLAADPDVLEAIRWHTTGTPGMGPLARVIWVADLIEPGRAFPGVERLRALAARDLDEALLAGLDQTIVHIIRTGRLLHLASVRTRNWLLARRRGQGLSWPLPEDLGAPPDGEQADRNDLDAI